jgi:hypothetical protein
MSTIELVDPELRDALALWPQVSLTAETLTRRHADALALLSSVPIPDLADIATGEIHVESAFGAQPIRVLTYRHRYQCAGMPGPMDDVEFADHIIEQFVPRIPISGAALENSRYEDLEGA